jgi:hypothetical protein
MARLTRLPLYGVLAVVFAGLAQPAEFNELFQAFSRADNGGCQGYLDRDGLFDNWHQEVYDMVEAAVRGLDEYSNVVPVQAAVKSFFGISPNRNSVPAPLDPEEGDIYGESSQPELLSGAYTCSPTHLPCEAFFSLRSRTLGIWYQVEIFLNGGGTPKKSPLPWLFCDSTFLTPKDPTHQAQDIEGKRMTAPDLTPIVIGNEYRTQLTGGKRPFWSEDMHTYVFEPPGQGDAYCASVAGDGGVAVTIDTVHNELDPTDETKTRTAVTLCPLAFTDPNAQDTLRSLPITARTRLQAVQPKSLTLLHEIFHALFSETYFDSSDDEDCKPSSAWDSAILTWTVLTEHDPGRWGGSMPDACEWQTRESRPEAKSRQLGLLCAGHVLPV